MKFHYYSTTILIILTLISSIIINSANSNETNKHHKNHKNHKNKSKITNHMTPTPIQTAVLPTTTISSTSPSPTINTADIKAEYYASPSYNISYGVPAPILQTRNTWQKIVYGILFMIIGLIEVFYGYKLIRVTLLVMGFLFWSSTSVIILLIIDNSNETFRSALFYFAIWLGFGTLGGLLSYWCWHLGLILSSAYGGFAFIITILTLSHITLDILRYILITFFVLLPPLVVYRYEKHAINIATSIAGSYTFFYGIDEFANQGYKEMIQLARSDGALRFKPTIVIYILITFTLLLAAFGIGFEHIFHEIPCNNYWCGDKHRREEKHSEDENNNVLVHQRMKNFFILLFSQKLSIIKINFLKLFLVFKRLFNFI
ncbi:hypothetical protein RhiirA4_536859, partial [Rhizophagus irregularis]